MQSTQGLCRKKKSPLVVRTAGFKGVLSPGRMPLAEENGLFILHNKGGIIDTADTTPLDRKFSELPSGKERLYRQTAAGRTRTLVPHRLGHEKSPFTASAHSNPEDGSKATVRELSCLMWIKATLLSKSGVPSMV